MTLKQIRQWKGGLKACAQPGPLPVSQLTLQLCLRSPREQEARRVLCRSRGLACSRLQQRPTFLPWIYSCCVQAPLESLPVLKNSFTSFTGEPRGGGSGVYSVCFQVEVPGQRSWAHFQQQRQACWGPLLWPGKKTVVLGYQQGLVQGPPQSPQTVKSLI